MDKQTTPRRPWGHWPFAIVLLLAGLPLAAGGLELVLLGGSPFYLVAGIALVASAVLIARRRRTGAWLYWFTLAVTIAWAIGEAGFAPWLLVPRLGGPIVLGLWLLTPWPRRALKGEAGGHWRGLAIGGGAIVSAIAVGAALHTAFPLPADPMLRAGMTGTPSAHIMARGAGDDWEHYGNDRGGTRFSPLADITPANVASLKVAWAYRVGTDRTGTMPMMEVTPLKIGDTLYACTAYSDVIALDAETGRLRWRMRSGADMGQTPYGQCRGVAYYKVPGAAETTPCAQRILIGTIDARLITMDARTGRRCADFGRDGVVSLLDGMGEVGKGYAFVTSAPAVVRGRVVVGGWVADGQYWGEPSGVVRAFDAVTGRLAWAFDAGRLDRRTLPRPGETYTRSTPNSWAPMSADEALGLVYVPTGNSVPDYYGAQRRPFDDRFNSAVVAIDAASGAPRWVYRTVHHDVWDYDLPAQPSLIDLPMPGGIRRALVQPTKRGEFFVLDRVTGEPIHPVTEVPVPLTGRAPGERLSRTQPFSLGLPSLAGPDPSERTMWGATLFDQLWCRIAFRKLRYDGPFSPPGLTSTLVNPGVTGASNWGSAAIDVDRHLLIAPGLRIGTVVGLLPRDEADRRGLKPYSENSHSNVGGAVAQANTRFAATVGAFVSPLGIPCQSPPYGTLSAIDLVSGKLVWAQPFGTAWGSGPMGIASHLPLVIGAPATGGAITTRGGLTFIGASQDRMLRAYETATGRELWATRLPAAGMATPSTWRSPASGRQFIVIAAAGHKYIQSPPGDWIIAYALPKRP